MVKSEHRQKPSLKRAGLDTGLAHYAYVFQRVDFKDCRRIPYKISHACGWGHRAFLGAQFNIPPRCVSNPRRRFNDGPSLLHRWDGWAVLCQRATTEGVGPIFDGGRC